MTDDNRSLQLQLLLQLRAWIPHFSEAELRVWSYLISRVGRGDEKHLPSGEQRKLSVFPLVATIAKETGLKDRAVYNALAKLKARGLLTTYDRGKANGYVLNHRIKPDTCTTVQSVTCTPMQVSNDDTCTTMQANTCTSVHTEESNQEGINKELKSVGTHTAAQDEKEESGKSQGQEKIARVVELAKSHGYALIPMPRLAAVYDAATDAGMAKAFTHWTSFKYFAAKHYNCWVWDKHPDRKPESADLCHHKMPVGIAMRAYVDHVEEFSDDNAAL